MPSLNLFLPVIYFLACVSSLSAFAGSVQVYKENRANPPIAPAAPVVAPRPLPPVQRNAAPGSFGSIEHQDLMELERINAQNQKLIEKLNAFNPLGQNIKPKSAEGSAESSNPAESAQSILANPIVQKLGRVALDPNFMKNAQALIGNPNRYKLIYTEIGWVIFAIIFRSWFFSKSRPFKKAILYRLGVNIGFAAIASYFIPVWILGDPYREIVILLFKNFVA